MTFVSNSLRMFGFRQRFANGRNRQARQAPKRDSSFLSSAVVACRPFLAQRDAVWQRRVPRRSRQPFRQASPGPPLRPLPSSGHGERHIRRGHPTRRPRPLHADGACRGGCRAGDRHSPHSRNPSGWGRKNAFIFCRRRPSASDGHRIQLSRSTELCLNSGRPCDDVSTSLRGRLRRRVSEPLVGCPIR